MSIKLVLLPVAGLLSMALVKYSNININFIDKDKTIGRQEGFEECAKLVHPDVLRCCTLMDFEWPSDEFMVALEECGINKDNTQCQPDTCIANKWRLLEEGSTEMNYSALEDFVQDRWPDAPDNYVVTCVKGNVEYYDDTPDKTMCVLIRTRRCLIAQTIIGCGSFDIETNPRLCTGIESLAEYCTRVFPSML